MYNQNRFWFLAVFFGYFKNKIKSSRVTGKYYKKYSAQARAALTSCSSVVLKSQKLRFGVCHENAKWHLV
jgi:molybdopterin synthase catalytic subunit